MWYFFKIDNEKTEKFNQKPKMIEKVFQNDIKLAPDLSNLKRLLRAGTLQFFGKG